MREGTGEEMGEGSIKPERKVEGGAVAGGYGWEEGVLL